MLRVLFLIFVVMNLAVFAQTEKRNEARKVFELGKISDSLLKEKVEEFYNELRKSPDSQGCIINYGTNKEIAEREKQIRESLNFREQDAPRMTFISGGNKKKFVSEFWIVQNGAEPPTP